KKHRVYFKLKDNKKGFSFENIATSDQVFGVCEKKETDNFPEYKHKLNFIFTGLNESDKQLLLSFNLSNYFGAICYTDGTVEIYGFENGLKANDYSIDYQNNGWVAPIT